jgi:hypothetical protein
MPGAACASSPQAANALLLAADQLAHELKIDYLLLRCTPPGRTATWKCSKRIEGSSASNDDSEENRKSLPKDVRYHIRNGRNRLS